MAVGGWIVREYMNIEEVVAMVGCFPGCAPRVALCKGGLSHVLEMVRPSPSRIRTDATVSAAEARGVLDWMGRWGEIHRPKFFW